MVVKMQGILKRIVFNKNLDVYVNKETGEVLEFTGLIDKNGYKKYTDSEKKVTLLRHIKETQ